MLSVWGFGRKRSEIATKTCGIPLHPIKPVSFKDKDKTQNAETQGPISMKPASVHYNKWRLSCLWGARTSTRGGALFKAEPPVCTVTWSSPSTAATGGLCLHRDENTDPTGSLWGNGKGIKTKTSVLLLPHSSVCLPPLYQVVVKTPDICTADPWTTWVWTTQAHI